MVSLLFVVSETKLKLIYVLLGPKVLLFGYICTAGALLFGSSSNKKFAKKLFSDKRGEGARDDHGDDSADASNKTPSYLLVCTHILMFRN